MSDKCDMRDAQTKAASALKFLNKGHVVKVTLTLNLMLKLVKSLGRPHPHPHPHPHQVFALNTGRVCPETRRSRAQVRLHASRYTQAQPTLRACLSSHSGPRSTNSKSLHASPFVPRLHLVEP